MSPALAGRLSTTAPLGKSLYYSIYLTSSKRQNCTVDNRSWVAGDLGFGEGCDKGIAWGVLRGIIELFCVLTVICTQIYTHVLKFIELYTFTYLLLNLNLKDCMLYNFNFFNLKIKLKCYERL